tara:strand:+ start:3897 stop:4493 length:597 start_codon:yes stop_codon:yes gene_type:complete
LFGYKTVASEKVFIEADELLLDSYRLAAQVIQANFKPSFMIAIWRGGAPIGIAVQEFLQYRGIESDHIAIRTSSYHGIDDQASQVQVHGLNYLAKNVIHEDRLLIVDDVWDTGLTIEAVIKELSRRARLNTPKEIRIAVPYFKPERNKTNLTPDFYVHEVDSWLKFPHSLEGLTIEEVQSHRPDLYEIVSGAIDSDES